MPKISRAAICGVLVLAVMYLGGCKPVVVPIVPPPPPPPPPPNYDQSQISCSGVKPDRTCMIKFETVQSTGDDCMLDANAPQPPHPGGHPHLPFSLSISNGDRLMILPKMGSPDRARFRDFTLLTGPASCPAKPFYPGSSNGFGEDLTGLPNNFNGVAGCVYKMTVQTEELGNDSHHPSDPRDHGKQYLCVDPHFEMTL